MRKLINKLFILICCLIIYIFLNNNDYMVVRFIVVISVSALGSYFDKSVYRVAIFLIFGGLCLLFPDFIYFIPLICYDAFMESFGLWGLILLIPVIADFSKFTLEACSLLVLLTGTSFALKYYSVRLDTIKSIYNKLLDDTKELSISLEQKNRELLEKQDYEVNLATLNERNRIAREIHDSIGHIMSSSILQVGALIATVSDDKTKKSLSVLKDTLSEGMDSIRNSVHKLHEDSIDLYTQLYSLVRDFTFCKLSFECDESGSLPLKARYSILAIVKEALANIIKHSNATAAQLAFRELPGFYQLVISDNGSDIKQPSDSGMGLRNIRTRVESLGGHINIDSSNGFRIFISIPKDV